MLNLSVMISLPLTGRGPSYTCEQIASRMANEDMRVQLIAPADKREAIDPSVEVKTVLPRHLRWIPYRYSSLITVPVAGLKLIEEHRNLDESTVAFLWGDMPIGLVRRLKAEGIPIVREKFNCERSYSGKIIKRAYDDLGISQHFPGPSFTDAAITEESFSLGASDYIFSPSPMVRHSLESVGFDSEKIIDTSYGFDPRRLDGETKALTKLDDGTTFLFVGYLCVRKGAHVLLQAWEKAGINGRLILLGTIEPVIQELYAHILNRDDVEHHSFTSDVGSYYRSADYFVFPTLEEGGPQVTYEASYLGVPSIVSEMGAGAMISSPEEGIVLRDFEVDTWAQGLADAAVNREANRALGEAARRRAMNFTWDKVAAGRRQAILERFPR